MLVGLEEHTVGSYPCLLIEKSTQWALMHVCWWRIAHSRLLYMFVD